MFDHTLRLQLKTITAIAKEQERSKNEVLFDDMFGGMSYKAQLIVDQIPSIAQKAALDRLSKAQVMPITRQDFNDVMVTIHKFSITGDAGMVYSKCHSAGLNPSINMVDGRFAIFINW